MTITNAELATAAQELLPRLNDNTPTAANDHALIRRVAHNHLAHATFIAHKAPTAAPQRIELLEKLDKLNLGETETVCFYLDVPWDNLRGETKVTKQQALIEHLERRGRLDELAPAVNRIIPNLMPLAAVVRHQPKPDLIIVADLNYRRPMYQHVAEYLDDQHLIGNVLLFLPQQKPIPLENWQPFATLFQQALADTTANEQVRHHHFFLGGPLPLVFQLGVMWGTIQKATIYHFEDGRYFPVFPK